VSDALRSTPLVSYSHKVLDRHIQIQFDWTYPPKLG
jgi:hypothetical protein